MFDRIKGKIEALINAEDKAAAFIDLLTVILAEIFNIVAKDEGLDYVG